MGGTFIGEIRPFAATFAPMGWVECDGRTLMIQEFQALYALIGTQFGGNTQQGTFNVPDMRGRVAVGVGQGPGLTNWTINNKAGMESVTLTSSQIPHHNHAVFTNFGGYKTYGASFTNKPVANSSYVSRYLVPTGPTTANTYIAYGTPSTQTPSPTTTTMAGGMLAVVGTGGAHENRQPVLALRFAINAKDGDFPEFN